MFAPIRDAKGVTICSHGRISDQCDLHDQEIVDPQLASAICNAHREGLPSLRDALVKQALDKQENKNG